MKKNGRSKSKHVKQKNNSIVTSEGVAAKAEVKAEPEVNLQYLNANQLSMLEKKTEPLMVLEEVALYRYMQRLVVLEKEREDCELGLTADIIQKFNKKMLEFRDVYQQVEVVKTHLETVRTLSGLMDVLKAYGHDRTYRNPATNYRVPLDERIVTLALEFVEYYFGIYLSERKRYLESLKKDVSELITVLN